MFGFVVSKFSKDRLLYKTIKNILGFYPGNIFLYKLAFRHRSVSKVDGGHRRNNERLEYLGDAVLSTIVAKFLFKKYPNKEEGFLTEMRSKIVSRESLNKVGQKMGLQKYIQVDKHGNSGGFKSLNGDTLEALIGAIFCDKGYRFTEKVVLKRIIQLHIDIDEMENKEWNFKSKLIDWGQKEKSDIQFHVIETLRKGGKKFYKVEVLLDNEQKGVGLDRSIKAAEQQAAENAYKKFVAPLLKQEKKHTLMEETLPDVKHIALFASGNGSNVQRICEYFKNHPEIRPSLLICNRKDAFVLERARNLGLPHFYFKNSELNQAEILLPLLEKYQISHIVLAGYLNLIPPFLIEKYPEKIVNIHPSLLPNYGGKGMYGHHVHQAVIDHHEALSGITIHVVSEEYDRGRILFQTQCLVDSEDTPDTLAAKIHELEYLHFPPVIEKWIHASSLPENVPPVQTEYSEAQSDDNG